MRYLIRTVPVFRELAAWQNPSRLGKRVEDGYPAYCYVQITADWLVLVKWGTHAAHQIAIPASTIAMTIMAPLRNADISVWSSIAVTE